MVNVKSVYKPSGPSVPALNFRFCSMKQLAIMLLPLDGKLVHRKVTLQHYDHWHLFTTWVKTDNV